MELLQSAAPGANTYKCSLLAGRPIYVVGASTECSTLEKPPFHGTTPAQLKACARKNFKGAIASASVDGRRVANYRKLIAGTPAFTFHLPKNNFLGSKKRTGRSAAYGEGLLLRGLSAGTHTVHVTAMLPGYKAFET